VAWELRVKEEFRFRIEKCPVIIYIYKTSCDCTGFSDVITGYPIAAISSFSISLVSGYWWLLAVIGYFRLITALLVHPYQWRWWNGSLEAGTNRGM
jgi:hypothetical protein